MASANASVKTVPIKHLTRQIERYKRTVLQKSYTALGDVAKSAVETVKSAVIAAPPTRVSQGPTQPARKRKYGYLKDIPEGRTGAVSEKKYDSGIRLSRKRQGDALGMVNNGAVATGKYRDAWRAKRMRQGGRMGVLVYNTVTHAPRVEYGRLPGRMPPVQAIRKWLQAKFSLPYRKARKLAWPIAKSIARRGIPGRKIMTSPQTEMTFNFYMEEAIARAQLAAAKQVFG